MSLKKKGAEGHFTKQQDKHQISREALDDKTHIASNYETRISQERKAESKCHYKDDKTHIRLEHEAEPKCH